MLASPYRVNFGLARCRYGRWRGVRERAPFFRGRRERKVRTLGCARHRRWCYFTREWRLDCTWNLCAFFFNALFSRSSRVCVLSQSSVYFARRGGGKRALSSLSLSRIFVGADLEVRWIWMFSGSRTPNARRKSFKSVCPRYAPSRVCECVRIRASGLLALRASLSKVRKGVGQTGNSFIFTLESALR